MLHARNLLGSTMSDSTLRSTADAGLSSLREHTDGRKPARTEQNELLAALSPASYERLAMHLEPVRLVHGQVMWEPNAPIRSVYFPRNCVASLLVPLEEEPPVEAATVGWEGFVGVPVVLGADSTSSLAIAQIPGEAVRLPAAVLR